tara:strand:- start:322 stop:579 length:258 start_codon:yes stop_codon:yes gene_type:complete
MSRKTKINVLLPIKMVGELENMSKLGKRSDFIMKAIRSKLDGETDFNLNDVTTRQLLIKLKQRLEDRNDASAHMLKEIIHMELNA